MATSRLALRSSRAILSAARPTARPFSIQTARWGDYSEQNKRANDTADEHRKRQTEKPLNPHLTNTTSTIANEMPSVGKDAPPPEMLTTADPGYTPKDSVPENTHRMTGGTQGSKDTDVSKGNEGIEAGNVSGELGVGELEGAKFRVEPLRRTGEDANTMRARLLYQSRKRGTLESDLLLSTFADAHLSTMTPTQMQQYDLFLDENDWDIYYWCTQEPSPTSMEYAEGAGPEMAFPRAQGQDVQQKDEIKRQPGTGEWAQTVGVFKPAYRPVPHRWRGSEILSLLRRHVKERAAGGVTEGDAKVEGKGLAQSVKGTGGGGLGMMPEIRNFDR